VSWTSKCFWRLVIFRNSLSHSLGYWVFNVLEFSESAINTTSSRFSRFECKFLHHRWFLRSLGSPLRYRHIFAINLFIFIKHTKFFSSLWKRFLLHFRLTLQKFFSRLSLWVVIIISHKLSLGREQSSFSYFSTLWWIGQNILRCDHNIAFFVSKFLLYVYSISHMLVRQFYFLLDCLCRFESLIMTCLQMPVFFRGAH